MSSDSNPEQSSSRWPVHRERRRDMASRLSGLDVLACAVVLLDDRGQVRFANMAAEQLFDAPLKLLEGSVFARQFGNGVVLDALLDEAMGAAFTDKRLDLSLERLGRDVLELHCVAVVPDGDLGALLLEFREIDQRIRADREARIV